MSFELTPEQIEESLIAMRDHAEAVLKTDGALDGIIDAYTFDGKNMVMPLLYRTTFEKQMMFSAFKKMFKDVGVVCFFMVTEAWMLKAPKDAKGRAKKEVEEACARGLEHHPEREEVVVIHYISHQETKFRTYPMIRNKKGKFKKLGEGRIMDSVEEKDRSGLVPDMLPPLVDDSQDFPEFIN